MSLGLASFKRRVQVFGALQYRDFRLYWIGQVISVSGFQMVIVAEGWLIWRLTESEVLLGALGLANAAPAVVLTLFGGAVADRVELRRFLIILQVAVASALFVLATLAVTGVIQVWHIFAVAFVFGAVEAFDHPSRQAIFPHLLDRRELMNAVSLNAIVWPGTRIFGPAIGGIVIDRVGEAANSPLVGAAAAFYLAALGFALFGLFMFLVRVPPIKRSKGRNILREITDGLRFVWNQRLFTFLTGMNFMNVFFVVSHMALFPVFASDIFKGDASTLGVLHAVGGVGSLLGALVAANLGTFRHRGWLIFGGAAAQAMFIALFASARSYGLSLLLLPLAGIGSSIFMVASQSTVQLLVPDELRGRFMAIWGLNYGVLFPLGQMQMGAVAGLSRSNLADLLGGFAGAPTAVLLGASAMLTFTLLGTVANPRIRNLNAQELVAHQQSLAREYRDLQA